MLPFPMSRLLADIWYPLLGSFPCLEHDILCSCPGYRFLAIFWIALTVLVAKFIDDILSAMTTCVWHTKISTVIASIFIESNFLIRFVPLRA